MCNKEIAHAVQNGKRIIPIVVRDTEPKIIPKAISERNWIFCRDGQDNFIKTIEETLTTIHTDYEWLKYHTRLQVDALEWERNNHEKSFLLRGKELQDAELQLATNSSKEPYPTDLQREYTLKSRQATDRQRRLTTSIAIAGVIVLAVLAVIAFVQAGRATNQANIAQTAEANALNEASGRATAQALAEERAKIALARQLVAQAQSINANRNSKQMIAVMLAIKSMQLSPSVEAAQILQTNSLGYPVAHMTYNGIVWSVAFSPDGKYVVSGSCDEEGSRTSCTKGSARVWEAATGKEITRMNYDGIVWTVAFSPDGKYVVSGGDDNTARVWEAATGKEIARITHDGTVYSVAFGLDGKYVVSGSGDGTARVWEAATGKEIARMTHDNLVKSAAFSPDGKYVISGSSDNTAHVWVWQPEDLVSNACAYLPRNPTRAEWNQYLGDQPYEPVCPTLPIELEATTTP